MDSMLSSRIAYVGLASLHPIPVLCHCKAKDKYINTSFTMYMYTSSVAWENLDREENIDRPYVTREMSKVDQSRQNWQKMP